MTIQDFIAQIQNTVDTHADRLVDKPLNMNSQIIFQDLDGNELTVTFDTAGGNFFDPAVIVTVI